MLYECTMCICYKILSSCLKNPEKNGGNVDNEIPQTQRPPPPIFIAPVSQPSPFASTSTISATSIENSFDQDYSTQQWTEGSLSEEYIPSPVVQQRHPKLEDYDSVENLMELNVKQLKILLAINRVDFKGCIEKKELQEKAVRLWEDSQRKDISENTPTDQLCKVCMAAPLDCVLLECGHIASCVDCGKRLAECPICRQYVVRVVRTFKA